MGASVLYMEILLRVQADLPLRGIGLVYSALFAGIAALVVHLLASFFTGWARSLVLGICFGLITLLFVSQFIYFDIFRTYYSVFSAGKAGQVVEFTGDVLGRVGQNAGWLLLLLLPLIVFVFVRTSRRDEPVRWRARFTTAGVAVALYLVAFVGINLGDQSQNSPYDMYYRQSHPVVSMDQLGLVTSMRLDLQRTLFGFTPQLAPPPLASPVPPSGTDDPVPGAAGEPVPGLPDPSADQSGTPDPSPEPSDGREEAGETATPEAPLGDNVMDIDFERLIAESNRDDLVAMHQYFGSRAPSNQNEMTGLFEGYNLVLVTAEAYSHYAVDPVLTPTLYQMTHEGIHFTDFYNPVWGVSTSDGEYVATTGLIPKAGVWSMAHSGDNSMPLTMGNQLRRLGYSTYAYHNHTYNYYARDVSHPNLGYDYKGVGNGLEVAGTWPESDVEMIDVTTPEFLAQEPFHAYFMTVSGHLQYNFGGNFIAAKNRDLVAGLPYTDAGRAYLATQIELDRALELLMERLEEAGVAERTLIVLGADHYPYGLTLEQIDDLAGHTVDRRFELHTSSLIIYAKGMEPLTVDEPVASLDIIPTISNLLGLEFDSRLLMGRDVFSDADPLVIFSDRSFITDRGRYDSVARVFTPADGAEVPDDYRQAISDEIDRRFYYSAMVLDKDYYSIVLPER